MMKTVRILVLMLISIIVITFTSNMVFATDTLNYPAKLEEENQKVETIMTGIDGAANGTTTTGNSSEKSEEEIEAELEKAKSRKVVVPENESSVDEYGNEKIKDSLQKLAASDADYNDDSVSVSSTKSTYNTNKLPQTGIEYTKINTLWSVIILSTVALIGCLIYNRKVR